MTDFTKLSLAWYNSPAFVDMTDRQRVLLILVTQNRRAYGIRELAEAMRVQKPVVSRAVDTLQSAGLLQRVKDVDDKRLCLIEPTGKALALIANMQAIGR